MASIVAKRFSAGFSLVDSLAAFVVLALGLLALSRFHYGALSFSADAKARTEALNLAQGKLESFRGFARLGEYYADIADSDIDADGDIDTIDVASDGHSGTAFSQAFRRSWSAGQIGAGVSSYKAVRVTTHWTDSRNEPQTVVLASIIAAERPLNTGKVLQTLSRKIVACGCRNAGAGALLHGSNPAQCSDACCQSNDPGANPPYAYKAYCPV